MITSTGAALRPTLRSIAASPPSPQRSCAARTGVDFGCSSAQRAVLALAMGSARELPSVQTTARGRCSAAAHEGSAEVPQPSSTTTLSAHAQLHGTGVWPAALYLRARLGDCAASTWLGLGSRGRGRVRIRVRVRLRVRVSY